MSGYIRPWIVKVLQLIVNFLQCVITMPFRFNREGAPASLLPLLKKGQGNGSLEATETSQDMQANEVKVESIECACCGISEECTVTYINMVREEHCGEWICGLCSAAMKELKRKDSMMTMREAMESQKLICKQFDKNIRLNPELSFAGTMRAIARRSFQRRTTSEGFPPPNVNRSSSCGARIHH